MNEFPRIQFAIKLFALDNGAINRFYTEEEMLKRVFISLYNIYDNEEIMTV